MHYLLDTKNNKGMRGVILLLLILLNAIKLPLAYAQPRLLNVVYPYSSDEQLCMLIDRQGLIWIGSDAGLKSYDGYRFKTYRSNAITPNILPSNTILCMTEGRDEVLWIGTRNGLVSMNKKTGKFTTHNLSGTDNRIIYALFTSHDGKIWIGTDAGITCYLPNKKTFFCYSSKNTKIVEPDGTNHSLQEKIKAKSFTEDNYGNIYIGTWSTSLYRLDCRTNTLYKYYVGDKGKTYKLKVDYTGKLWICNWGTGIKCIPRPLSSQTPSVIDLYNGNTEYSIHYNMVEDRVSNTFWLASRNGFGVIDANNIKDGINYYKNLDNYSIPNVTDVQTDGKGNVWLLTRNNGLYHLYTKPSLFHVVPVIPQEAEANRVSSIFTIDGKSFWLTLSPSGIAYYDLPNHHALLNANIPSAENIPLNSISTHYSDIIDNGKGAIWFANNGFGITQIKDGKANIIDETKSGIVNDRYVNTLYRSKQGIVFAGEKNHLNYMLPSGKSYTCLQGVEVKGITEDHRGNIWVATENKGVVRISGNFRWPKSLAFRYYNASHANFITNDALDCLEDSKHRLWIISKSGGLFRYDEKEDKFVNVNKDFGWDVDRIFSIIEDSNGFIWLTTVDALICLQVDEQGKAQYTVYTKEDGLGELTFQYNSCFKYGTNLYFGVGRNLIYFDAAQLNAQRKGMQKANVVITDLFVDGKRYGELDSALRAKLCDVTPQYMHTLTLPSSINKFAIEFALLTYTNTAQCKYAYYLEGYDKEWHYVDADLRQASFENLPSGIYKLHVKAVDSYGKWNEMPYTIRIKVLPPWYASWWAYLIYICIFLASIRIAIIWYRERLRTKNRLQMAVVFTNITHELLTPLTIISAAAESISRISSDTNEQTNIIQDNINRLTRMLRQILEVRKSQAGKLQLKVSEGDFGEFCMETARSLMPMFTAKQLHFDENINLTADKSWFDTDKVEKILYNLLSNAAKYTEEGGKVSLHVRISNGQATIIVADTGRGISKDKMKHLYNRFLDGDYRQMNTLGTGIGLSLVKDLVKLHHGKIQCESEEGRGTTFTITLPINKEDYSETEILKEQPLSKAEDVMVTSSDEEIAKANALTDNSNDEEYDKEYTILLVEDNNELLTLMSSLLSARYKVLTANNGEKAQKIIQKASLDVVVTDVMMPVMDGIELTKWIKGSDDYSQLPVVMLTAKTQDADRNEGYKVGADAYLTKPFKLEDLLLRIDNIIANRQRIRRKFQSLTDFKVEDQHYSSPDELFVQSCIDKIKEHIDDCDFGREQMAAELCVSSSTLYNKLRAITGMNISGFITSIRMKEACQILKREPTIRINELAYRVGFNTPKYFSLCFKKEYGMSVREYVEQSTKKCLEQTFGN